MERSAPVRRVSRLFSTIQESADQPSRSVGAHLVGVMSQFGALPTTIQIQIRTLTLSVTLPLTVSLTLSIGNLLIQHKMDYAPPHVVYR